MPSAAPAPAASEVTEAGMSMTNQCQNPLGVGASGSYIVTAKLFVPAGNFDQESWGERSWPPGTPKAALIWAGGRGDPVFTSALVSAKEGTLGRLS